jgi:hypothetical protein
MIIKQTRVKVGGAQKLVAHITNTAQNDAVMILKGHLGIPADGDLIAQMYNRTYGNRHVIISPQVSLTRVQLDFVLTLIFQELNVSDVSHTAHLLIQHNKIRHDHKTHAPHFHLVLNETTSVGDQLEERMSYVTNEKIARLCELKFNHKLTKGRHNYAVVKSLEGEGRLDEAKALRALLKGPPAFAAFSSQQLRKAERYTVNLPRIYYLVKDISDPDLFMDRLAILEAEQGLVFQLSADHRQLLILKNGQTIADIFKFIEEKELIHAIISKLQSRQPGI